MKKEEGNLFSPEWYQCGTAMQRAYFKPVFLGLDAVDLSRPALWVGNHTLYGLLDAPLLANELMARGTRLYSLGDRGHFKVPGWRALLEGGGVVEGSPENCTRLMSEGKHVLVFPGGAREVMKRKGENYALVWKQRTGFARMAIKHGYDIQPFAAVGADEAFEILFDANDVKASRMWRWLSASNNVSRLTRNGDAIPPLVKGIGPTLIPRPQRFYFGFGPRISVTEFKGLPANQETLMALREKVAASIESQLDLLERYRETDRARNWSRLRRFMAK